MNIMQAEYSSSMLILVAEKIRKGYIIMMLITKMEKSLIM